MSELTRRTLLAGALAPLVRLNAQPGVPNVEQWGRFELPLAGPADGNPFRDVYPFPREGGVNDYTRFVPAFFQNLEKRIEQLQALGIEADLILFHPYDHWGYALMPPEVDDAYLAYVVARLAAYRNVWWSVANE